MTDDLTPGYMVLQSKHVIIFPTILGTTTVFLHRRRDHACYGGVYALISLIQKPKLLTEKLTV
jgi:drug/metabolite transporter superfamily protein YnfA